MVSCRPVSFTRNISLFDQVIPMAGDGAFTNRAKASSRLYSLFEPPSTSHFRHQPWPQSMASSRPTAALITRQATGTADELQERVWAALVLLAAFETEMSFLLSDVQESVRARSERAFSHLQRSLVVDATLRDNWLKAFDAGEVECEKLGAMHLLLHGIWAFKVDAAGARTDLVFQEPVVDLAAAQRSAEGLVLTEWKKAGPKDNPRQRFEEARAQARRYAQGALAGIELTGSRYLVVVSRRQIQVPDDLNESGIIYRHVNIPVEPEVPSRA